MGGYINIRYTGLQSREDYQRQRGSLCIVKGSFHQEDIHLNMYEANDRAENMEARHGRTEARNK